MRRVGTLIRTEGPKRLFTVTSKEDNIKIINNKYFISHKHLIMKWLCYGNLC